MPDKKKTPRPASIMGDEGRSGQPRPAHPYPPTRDSASAVDVPDGVPIERMENSDATTPPPIVVDDIGRPLARSRPDSPPPVAYSGRRDRKTIQEFAEELWPARKALQMVIDNLQRIVALETKVEDMEANGPAAVAAVSVAALRAELIGSDGSGGIINHLNVTIQRDLDDHRRLVTSVDDRATKAERFVRRMIVGACGTVAGSLVAAVMLIYSAGGRVEASKAEAREERMDLVHKIDVLEGTLTDLHSQVKLMLEARIRSP